MEDDGISKAVQNVELSGHALQKQRRASRDIDDRDCSTKRLRGMHRYSDQMRHVVSNGSS